jgi:hypothetical protein
MALPWNMSADIFAGIKNPQEANSIAQIGDTITRPSIDTVRKSAHDSSEQLRAGGHPMTQDRATLVAWIAIALAIGALAIFVAVRPI